jgi:hypothetical protein
MMTAVTSLTMPTLLIDEELRAYIPALTPAEYAALEASILAEGCRDALVVVLIDGYNRYAICQKHGLPFATVQHTGFTTLDDVLVWMIDNQLARRNLSDYSRGELALKKKDIFAKLAKANLVTSTGGNEPQPLQNSAKAGIDTRKEIATIAGMPHDTITKIEAISANAVPDVIAAVRTGVISINAAAQIATLSQETSKPPPAARTRWRRPPKPRANPTRPSQPHRPLHRHLSPLRTTFQCNRRHRHAVRRVCGTAVGLAAQSSNWKRSFPWPR